MNLRQLLLLWVWKVSLVWGQATENVRQNTYALEDGRTIWNIARIQDTNIWKNNLDISQPGVADALDKSSLDDMVVVYDTNRTLLFQKPVPKVIKDKEAQWVSLPNGDLGYFYVKFGTHTLYLQIYSPTGEPKLGPFPYSEVLCFSASASSQRVDGRHYIAVAFVETNLQVKLLLLNPDGSQRLTTKSTLPLLPTEVI
ncbi:hypothetical protein K7432_015002 [Basidiobolus ranarum]|uniref:Uncharacterized protein n=1 Tax=Basidiobolus ranarum TaxID=34480 RepID=A0ABR2VPQ6_9FUNG